MTIHQLPEGLINQIAAGEVVEKPASIVKELVENAVDSGATEISVSIRHAGKSFIAVRDNGCGMTKDELPLALTRHATSKLNHHNLEKIESFGFRGEALPAIAAVSRLQIKSATDNHGQGWQISLEGGKNQQIKPIAMSLGTLIEVRDIFYATPARLKFLRSDRYESLHIFEALAALILATPQISYRFHDGTRERFFIPAISKPLFCEDFTTDFFERMKILLGSDPHDNYALVQNKFENMQLNGYAGLPTFHSARTDRQFFFVNGRAVKDKLLSGALRGAYADFITSGRHPACVLFLTLPYEEVDVNVHPAKTEIRFRDPQKTRSFIFHSLKRILAKESQKTADDISLSRNFSASAAEKSSIAATANLPHYHRLPSNSASVSQYRLGERGQDFLPPAARDFQSEIHEESNEAAQNDSLIDSINYPMGAAVAQLHLNYIVAQTKEGFLIIDQHAAHERIVYEQMKQALHQQRIESQRLLVPEILHFTPEERDLLLSHQDNLFKIGLEIEAFGNNEIILQAIPSLLKKPDFNHLFEKLLEELKNYSQSDVFIENLERVCATMACYGSIRSGRAMSIADMNALLRKMEVTPNSGQCNHGRPTFIKMTLHDLEKLFDRR